MSQGFTKAITLDTDGTLSANSDMLVASQKAVKTYVDNSVSGLGDVTKVGTPVDNQIGVWTGDGTIEGDPNLIWDGSVLTVTNTGGLNSNQVAIFQNDSGTPADNDEAYMSLKMSDDGGGQTEVARMTWAIPDDAAAAEYGRLDFSVMTAGTLAKELQLSGDDLSPSADDGLSLGTINLKFSDLFLASGGVIDWDANDVTLTHSLNHLTLDGGDLIISNLTPSEIVITDGTSQLVSASVATYPSLTELSYVKGATSSLQTQINSLTPANHLFNYQNLY